MRGQMNGWIEGQRDKWMRVQMNGWMDRLKGKSRDRWMNEGQRDGWMD